MPSAKTPPAVHLISAALIEEAENHVTRRRHGGWPGSVSQNRRCGAVVAKRRLGLRSAIAGWGEAADCAKYIEHLFLRHNIGFDLHDGFATVSSGAGDFAVWMTLVWLQCSYPYNSMQLTTNIILRFESIGNYPWSARRSLGIYCVTANPL